MKYSTDAGGLACLAVAALVLYAAWGEGASAEVIRKTDMHVPDSGDWGNYSGTLSYDNKTYTACPDGRPIISIQGFTSGSALIALRYLCAEVEGINPVRKTSAWEPDSGSWTITLPGWQFSPNGTIDYRKDTPMCPSGYFVNRIEGIQKTTMPWHITFLSDLRYSCTNLFGASVIRKTDLNVPDSGGNSVPHDLAIATCPAGSFVYAIQGFAYGELGTPIVQLRFSCK